MSELSLFGHEAALADLADETKMSNDRLQMHITELEKIRTEALKYKIGRQVDVSTRLLLHFGFERSQRAGLPADMYATLVQSEASQEPLELSELVGAEAEAVAEVAA